MRYRVLFLTLCLSMTICAMKKEHLDTQTRAKRNKCEKALNGENKRGAFLATHQKLVGQCYHGFVYWRRMLIDAKPFQIASNRTKIGRAMLYLKNKICEPQITHQEAIEAFWATWGDD